MRIVFFYISFESFFSILKLLIMIRLSCSSVNTSLSHLWRKFPWWPSEGCRRFMVLSSFNLIFFHIDSQIFYIVDWKKFFSIDFTRCNHVDYASLVYVWLVISIIIIASWYCRWQPSWATDLVRKNLARQRPGVNSSIG